MFHKIARAPLTWAILSVLFMIAACQPEPSTVHPVASSGEPQVLDYQLMAENPADYRGAVVKVTGRILDAYTSSYNTDYSAWGALVTNSAPGHTASRLTVLCLDCGMTMPAIGDSVDLVGFATGEASESDYRIDPWRMAAVVLVAN